MYYRFVSDRRNGGDEREGREGVIEVNEWMDR